MSIDTSSPTGSLVFNLTASIYQFEREIMLERQMVGVAHPKKEGKYSARVPTVRKKRDVITKLHKQGLKPSQIAKELNIGVALLYRYREVA